MRWLIIIQKFRSAGLAPACGVVLCSLLAASAQPPPEVINRATLQYFHSPSGLTNQLDSTPVRALVSLATNPPAPSILRFYRDGTYAVTTIATTVGATLYVQADAPGCNLDPAVAETNVITLGSELTGDSENHPAVETAPDSGVFRIVPGVPTRSADAFPVVSGNGLLETRKLDTLTASLAGCGTNTALATVLVDPGGIVFDSRANTPMSGAQVTLLDAASGLPAIVFQADGTTPAPNPVTTGADGAYVFPSIFPGSYRLLVVPPPGYTAPSQVPLAQLPAGRSINVPGSFGGTFTVSLANNPLAVDFPVDALTATNGSGLFVQKAVSNTEAEVGDLLEYTVRVKNVTGGPLANVRVIDQLPLGFAYQSGSTRLDGLAITNPAGGAGPRLEFIVPNLANDATASVTYRVRVGPGAPKGNGENTAQAVHDGLPPRVSNLARVRVTLTGGVFTDRGHLLGKVFLDANTNRVQDAGEPGVPGVRLYLEDGTYAITDGEGKYSLYGLRARTHVLKVDPVTLPRGARLVELSTRDALSPGTRFLEMKFYELLKADFALAPASPQLAPAVMNEILERRKQAGASGGELELGVKTTLTRDGTPQPTGDPRGLSAAGIVGAPPGAAQRGTNITPGMVAGTNKISGGHPLTPALSPSEGERERVRPPSQPSERRGDSDASGASPSRPMSLPLPLQGGEGRGEGVATSARTNHTEPGFSAMLPPDTLTGDNSNLLPQRPLVPRVPLEQVVTNLDNALGFLDLKDGDTLPAAQLTVRVKGVHGASLTLQVNGEFVSASRIGKIAVLAEKRLQAWEFVGVSLATGTNTLTLTQRDAGGNVRGRVEVTVVAPDKLGRVRILLPKRDQPADGRTPATVTVLLEDARGVPVTARTPLTLESGLGTWQVADLNKTEPGVQVFLEGGRGEFVLMPPLEPGVAKVSASSGSLGARAELAFLPELRPILAVGVIEGRLGLSSLKAGSIVPARSQDGFEEELRAWSVSGDDGQQSASARAAFFLKGRIRGEYLLTAGYDSDKDTKERLFRDIQPDEFYPVYGDDGVKGFDAQSTSRLYVRIDKRKSYLLYGDFTTAGGGEARGLGNYSRSLTGLKEHYEKKNLAANLWASYDSARQVIEELRGNGTSGPYFFSTANGIVNSEKVELLTRDRNQPANILRIETLTRFVDYEFEPFTGRILFRRPIPSLDANLNPIFIRVTYEVEQGGDKFWAYGADAQVKLTPRWEVGGAGVRDENPLAPYGLYSANTTFKLAERTFLLGEVARSDVAGTLGDAGRAELRHQDSKTDVRIYYGHADGTFSNSASVLSGGRIESGAKVTRQVGRNTRVIVQGLHSEGTGPNVGTRQGVTLNFERLFTNQMRLELGGRYSTETVTPASPSTATPPGVTPNDVRSLRIKFTTPVPKVRNAFLYGEFENDVVETDKRMAAVGGEYQVGSKTRLYARHEFIDSLGGPFELNNFQQQNTTVVGLDTEYMRDGKIFNEYRMRDAISGREAEAATGLRNQWSLAEGLRLSTGFERVSPVTGGEQNEATALTGGIEYTRPTDWKATARLELRTATANDSLLNTFGYARKLNRDWTFLGRTIVYLVDAKGPSGGDSTQARIQTGLAWRQTATDRWNALMKYEFKIEEGPVYGSSAALDRRVNILSLHANWQPAADWLLSGHYAGKLAFEDDGEDDVYHAHLLAFHVTYEIGKRWDVGLNSSVLFSGGFDSTQYALGPEIGFTLRRNLRVGVGYNFIGFNDRDLSGENYTQQGVYLALRFKFDEELLGLGRKEEGK